ncbi:hypothetical protein BCR44DRAFT_1288341 [Catenaria anguillulae PL171]|uniref:COP9 signalosome complex subunit 3 n=1 Tax=Catenaria anguillulae PL171 TaxID=765915 RepID=A0A1Y2H8I2_9FUNG|nr:hypothetical protein BCR44DRAFT_1288341 [Catenaria anguillulae PL171]
MPISVEDVLKYHYYGGMLLTGLKQHERAMEMFYFNLSIPTRGAISAIQIESYRKLLLTSLIHTGQTTNYAGSKSDRNNPAITASHTASEPYHLFAKAYAASLSASSDSTRVDKLLATHAAHFEATENLGLVRQAMSVLRAHTVRRLTNTYITISVRELAKTMGSDVTKDEAERIIVQMVAAGKIKARIEHAAPCNEEGMAVDGQESEDMVEFVDEDDEEAGEAGATGEVLDQIKAAAAANVAEVLAQKIKQALAAGERVKEAEKGVLLSYAKTARAHPQSREGSMFLGSTPGTSSMYVTADEDMDLS